MNLRERAQNYVSIAKHENPEALRILTAVAEANSNKSDWCPLCEQGWDAAKEDQKHRILLIECEEVLQKMSKGRYTHWQKTQMAQAMLKKIKEGF